MGALRRRIQARCLLLLLLQLALLLLLSPRVILAFFLASLLLLAVRRSSGPAREAPYVCTYHMDDTRGLCETTDKALPRCHWTNDLGEGAVDSGTNTRGYTHGMPSSAAMSYPDNLVANRWAGETCRRPTRRACAIYLSPWATGDECGAVNCQSVSQLVSQSVSVADHRRRCPSSTASRRC
jgi:hypothetical protein